MKIQLSNNVCYQPGVLKSIYTNVRPILKTAHLKHIATIYGELYKYSNGQLFDLIWGPAQNIRLKSGVVNTQDMKAFTLLRFEQPPGKYWKPEGTQIQDTSACGAVPLALLGARNICNVSYNKWFEEVSSLEDEMKLDLFLGWSFSTAKISNGTFIQSKSPGLYQLRKAEIKISSDAVMAFRDCTKKTVTSFEKCTDPNISQEIRKLFNDTNWILKNLIVQQWVFDPQFRCSDMITNIMDWDKLMVDIDKWLIKQGLEQKPPDIDTNIKDNDLLSSTDFNVKSVEEMKVNVDDDQIYL